MSNRDYISLNIRGDRYVLSYSGVNPYNSSSIKRYDQLLHQTLCKIFRERGLESDKVRELFRTPFGLKRNNSISILMLAREPVFSQFFKTNYKLSLLWIAVLCCYQDSAELLVRSGADVNKICGLYILEGNSYKDRKFKKSPLFHVLLRMYPSSWNERFIGLLIEHGADWKTRDSHGSSALHVALDYYRVKVIKFLIEKGADVNVADNQGITPLLVAARSRKADELVPLLMRHGAHVTVRDKNGRNALHHLASAPGDHTDLARVLIKSGVSLDDEGNSLYHYLPIHTAAELGKNELVNLFLDYGSDVNKLTGRDRFPLSIATVRKTLTLLLKRGANIDLKNGNGQTALHIACFQGRISFKNFNEKIKLLLLVGADMFAEDNHGFTSFYFIDSEKRNTLMIKQLALRKACLESSIEFKDERILRENYLENWNYYQDCIEELNRSKSARFIETCTVFKLLTECQCQMAELMRHHEFDCKFKLYNLSIFPMYSEDIVEAFERAKCYYQSLLDVEDTINEAVCYILPDMITRKIANYAINCEICEIKEVVRKSRKPSEGTYNAE